MVADSIPVVVVEAVAVAVADLPNKRILQPQEIATLVSLAQAGVEVSTGPAPIRPMEVVQRLTQQLR